MWWAGRLFVGPSFSPLEDSKTTVIFETPTLKESHTLHNAICECFVISDISSQSHWRTFPRRETQNTGFVYNCWKQAVIFGYHNRQEREKHKNVEKNINLDNCKILPVDDVSDDIFWMLVPLQSSSSIMFYGISYPCLQIRASWGESKCGGDIEVLAKELQQLLGQVEQGQHLLVHHLQPHLDPPDVLRLRRLTSLRCASVTHCCSKGSPSRSLPFETPSFVLLKLAMMRRRGNRKRKFWYRTFVRFFPNSNVRLMIETQLP